MNDSDHYQTPLSQRYASQEMSQFFSPKFKYLTWRKLWIALAKSQRSLGLPITEEQIKALEKEHQNLDLKKATDLEQITRHEVMAHILAYAEVCPEAKGILHLGATSCYVTDNTDLLQMQEGLKLLRGKLVHVIRQLSSFAATYDHVPTLSYTHYQPAQPTTVGKRACLWIQDFLLDLKDLEERLKDFPFLGLKGATGTQASFLELFDHDHSKVKALEELVAKEMGFSSLFSISGQTYTRKQDMRILSVLSGIAVSAHKFATDLRLLAHLKEIEEPFAEKQIGSSAMPYKRNPMRCERICGLSRFLLSLQENPAYTAALQWLERTLDDSSNRRLSLPESFLTADAILNLLIDVTQGLVVYPNIIEKHLKEELPFMALENVLMAAVKKGKDRQDIHEKLKLLSQEMSNQFKEQGKNINLIEKISSDPSFGLSKQELDAIIDVKYFIGRSIEQTHEFLNHVVNPILEQYKNLSPHLSSIYF
jgi:adenylosuccinate lyase